MILVLDTSAAVEFLLQRAHAARIDDLIAGAEWVLAPTLYVAELTNTLWKYYSFSSLSQETCERAVAQGLALPDTLAEDMELYREAFSMACLCRVPVYDMFYLVLARRHAASLLTLDNSLAELARKHDVHVATHS